RVLNGRHAVIEHICRDHQAVVVSRLLAHGLPHAHPHRGLDLAFDREPVERLAAIVRHPDFVDGNNAGLFIDRDFNDLRRIAVAHGAADRGAAIFLAAARLRNGRVVAGDDDGAAIFESLRDDFVEGQPLVLRAGAIKLAQALDLVRLSFELARRGGDQKRFKILRRFDRGIADHEGDPGGIRTIVFRHYLAVAADDADTGKIEPETLGDSLPQHRRRALADLGGAGEQDDGAVEIELELDRGMRFTGPVHRLQSAVDLVKTAHAEALAARHLPFARFPAALALDPIEAFRQAV